MPALRWMGISLLLLAIALLAGGKAPARPAAPPSTPDNPALVSDTTSAQASARRTQGAANIRTVVIDPGHGGPDSGAVHRNADGQVDLVEKEVNLAVARNLARWLRAAGYVVVLTRETDTALSAMEGSDFIERTRIEQQARIDIANKALADIVVSVHHNGYGDPAVSGTETYYCSDRPFSEQSQMLATLVLDGLANRFADAGYVTYMRGVKDDASIGARYGQPHSFLLGTNPGIDPSRMPGIFGEALFISNDEEAALLLRQDFREAEALGYFDGIQAYLAWLDRPE